MKSARFRPGILHGARGAEKGFPGRGSASRGGGCFTGMPTRIGMPGRRVLPLSRQELPDH